MLAGRTARTVRAGLSDNVTSYVMRSKGAIMKRTVLSLVLFAAVSAFGGTGFESARPVWPKGEERTMNSFFRFRGDFEAREDAKALLRVTSGYDYKAWLDGAFVAFGPARTAPGFFRVDEWPLKVKSGRNVVEIDVAGYNCNNFYLPDQTPFLQAEVVIDGKVVAKTAADGDFAVLTTGRIRKVPRFSYQRTFAEVYRLPHVATAIPMLVEQPAKKILPRAWDKPDFHIVDGFRALLSEKVVWDKDVKVQSNRYIVSEQANYKYFKVEELEENPFYDIQRLKTVSRSAAPEAKDGWYPISENEGIVFSGANEEAGFPMLRVRCESPVTIYFTFDEFLQDDGSVNQFRAETLGTLVWHLGKGEYALEGFEPVAFKCARVLAVGGAAEVKSPAIRTYVSPSAERASFKASDPALEMIFNAAKASYAANAVDSLTDCPIRERAGWLGDTFFTGRASRWLTGSARNEELFLDNFRLPEDYGAEPKFRGLVPAVWPVDLMTDDCFIPNYDFWLVLELEELLARGGDAALVRAFRSKVMDVVGWFDHHLNADGLLEKLPGWVFVEWSKANALVQDVNYPSNMMYAKMLDAIARLYALPDLAARAAKIRETVRRQSLTADGWYCDNAVRQADGTLKLSGERTEICQYYAFFTGVADKERDVLLWKRLVEDFGPERLKNARWKEKGLWARLHTPMIEGKWKEIWPANFIFGTCLRLELLSRDGRGAQIYREVRDYFLQMAEKTGTLWEHNDPRASCCHGFASIASEYLFRDVLGVRRIDGAAKTIRIAPSADLPLEWCEGVIPLSSGETAHIAWRKADGKPVLELRMPEGWTDIR